MFRTTRQDFFRLNQFSGQGFEGASTPSRDRDVLLRRLFRRFSRFGFQPLYTQRDLDSLALGKFL